MYTYSLYKFERRQKKRSILFHGETSQLLIRHDKIKRFTIYVNIQCLKIYKTTELTYRKTEHLQWAEYFINVTLDHKTSHKGNSF